MDETPPDAARRRLLFRATHRGTKENDLLLGGFVQQRLASFSAADMAALEEIMELPDPLLADWLTGRVELPSDASAMLQSIRAAAVKPNG